MRAVAAGLVLVVLTALALALRRRWPYAIVGWLWYLGTLVPVLGIVQVGNQAMADRYAYIPLLGIFLMVVWLLADGMENFAISKKRMLLAMAACVLLALSMDTRHELMYWQDSVTLWSRSIQVTGNNIQANMNYGKALLDVNKPAEALMQYKLAVADNPLDPAPRYEMTAPLLRLEWSSRAHADRSPPSRARGCARSVRVRRAERSHQ